MPETMPFRDRAHEVTRLEAFSDVVFGFALTLLVVSLEVPQTFNELLTELRGVPAFAICFGMLILVWHAHFRYCRRYNLSDGQTVVLNAVLLFVVLIYVYPLKFLFSLITGGIHTHEVPIVPAQVPLLFKIYGAGFAGVFLLLALLYVHAWRRRDELELNATEEHDTVTAILEHATYAAVGLLSIAIATFVPLRLIGFAGWTYFLMAPGAAMVGAMRGRSRRRVEESVRANAA